MDINNKQAKYTLEKLTAHKDKPSFFVYPYGIFRLLCIIVQNIYSVTSYFILSWILFLPFIWLKSDLYVRLENYLYNSLLFIVSSWSIAAGITAVEIGDDFKHLIEDQKISNTSIVKKKSSSNLTKNQQVDNTSSSEGDTRKLAQTKKIYVDSKGDTNNTNIRNCYTHSNSSNHLPSDSDLASKIIVSDLNGYIDDSDESTNTVKVPSDINQISPPNSLYNNSNQPVKVPPNFKLSTTELNQTTANPRVLFLCNHISTADVPLLMQAFSVLSKQSLLWVLDAQFKLTNFGLVSWSHEDFFIAKNKFVEGSLKDHLQKHPERNMIILFPEGGFWRKRLEGSNRYATKSNLPFTKYVTHPRFGAFNDLIDPSLNVTHIVDITLLYDDLKNPLSILDIITGWRKESVILKYKLYERNSINADEKWLRNIWLDKDELLDKYYNDRSSFYEQINDPLRIIKLNWFKVLCVHMFFILVFYLVVYKLVINY